MSAQADYPMPHNWSANTAENRLARGQQIEKY